MNDPNLLRRLTTIMAIDVVSFSTMSARNEERALGLLGARMGTAETLIKHHRGRPFKATGDGMLAEFASPVEAVRAALEIQEAMRSANAVVDLNDQLVLRIGINLGDIVESGDDLMGDAVNVAVRLESIASHGGICVSASVYEQLVGKLTLGAVDMGEQHVKNIPRPIHAYRLTPEGAAPATAAATATTAATAPARKGPSRLLLAGGAVALVAIIAVAGFLLMRDTPKAAQPAPQKQTASGPAPTAPAAASRPFVVAEVPFAGDFRRRVLENYAAAEGAKALAINVRGFVAFASRRVDDATARRIALEGCKDLVKKEVPVVRDFDGCSIYAAGDKVVWSFRTPPMPPQPYISSSRPSPPIAMDPATVPLIAESARKFLAERYMTSDRHRSLVLGRNQFEWWAPGESEADTVRRNLQACGHITGRTCFVYAVDDKVVARVPQGYRLVDVFTPQDVGQVDAQQQAAIERYLIADDWRAIATSRNGRIGIAVGRPNEAAAASDAVRECARAGGSDCTVFAVGHYLVATK